MYIFGSGNAFATPFGASAAANPSPMELGILQETNIDFAGSQKELMGKYNFPVAIARTVIKLDIKFKFANQYAKFWNDSFFGGTVAAGSEIGVADFSATPASNAVTITPPNSGVFARNLGVRDGLTGQQMTLVSGTPAVGQYQISGAIYTFHTGLATAVLISYTYTLSTQGFSSTVTNQPMGTQPTLDVTVMNSQYANLDGSINCLFRFPACIASKNSLPMKNEDWTISEFDCAAFATAANQVMYINFDE